MRKIFIYSFTSIFLLIQLGLVAQISDPSIYNPKFNTIKAMDRFGHFFELEQLTILTAGTQHPIGAKPAPTNSCSAGYFNVFFGQGSGMDVINDPVHQSRRNVVCQVFNDLSNLIISTLNSNPSTPKVNILVDDLAPYIDPPNTPSNSGVLGIGSSYYAELYNVTTIGGIIPGEVWKTIQLGNDSYINAQPLVGPSFYHGVIAFNFSNPSINWFYPLNSGAISTTQNDFYSVVLHESTHMLGIASLIKANGSPFNSPYSPYYSFYDSFLKTPGNVSLINNSPNTCNKYNYYFNVNSSVLAPTCPSYTTDVTTCSLAVRFDGSINIPVYTPGCYEEGSSLSHFEDYCYAPGSFSLTPPFSNNKYFLMSNAQLLGNDAFKRYLKPEERIALCDLGYRVNSVNNSTVFGASFNYSTTTCPGKDIAGLNDGYGNNSFTFVTSNNVPITISNINSNDKNASGYSCLQTIVGLGNLSTTSGTFNAPFTYTPTSGSGLHVLRYLPVNSLGQTGNITYIYVLVVPNYTSCNTSTCNLVRNGGFEQALAIPIGPSQINSTCGWETANPATPDYLHAAASFTDGVSIPCNNFGYEPLAAGSGSAHIGVFCNNPGGYNEIVYTKLSSPLLPNTAYNLTFDVSLAEPNSNRVYPLQAYFSNSPNFVSPNLSQINVSNPAMLFTTAQEFTVTNGWQQAVINFTTGSTPGLEYIAIGNLTNNPGVLINAAPMPTNCPLANAPVTYYFIDNIVLKTTSASGTFNLPANACSNQSISLNTLVNPTGGVFSGSFVTNFSGNYVFNSGQNIPAGSYNIAYTYTTGGCTYTIFKQIQVGPSHTVNVNSNISVICTNLAQTSSTLVASSSTSNVVFNWQPGGFTVNPLVVSPSVSTVYTVTGNNAGCLSQATIAVNVNSACCTGTIPAFNGNTINGVLSQNTSLAFNNDITIAPGALVYLNIAEYVFAPYTKITVKPGASLFIDGAHLYGCQNEMWNGIVLEDGARLFMYKTISANDNLFEDAILGIDVNNHATSTYTSWGSLLNISNTIFNKNFVSISIVDYKRDLANYPFLIRNCVFTSRTLTFTPSSWPNVSVTGTGLRTANTATNGLNAPYLMQGIITNLKAPYNSQPAHIGVLLGNVGLTNGSTYRSIQIGSTANVNEYNVFDAHGIGILANTSNLLSLNNVFQNSQRYIYPLPTNLQFGGTGIMAGNSNDFNSSLNLTANSTNPSFGNRFYNCHTAVNGERVFVFNCQYATIRSTQSSTNIAFGPGNTGIVLSTNRFNYLINNNNIANISTGINVLINPNTYTTTTGSGYGVYAWQLLIQNNYIGSQTTTAAPVTTQYVDNAINLSSTVGGSFHVGASSFGVITNTLNRVLRGVNINGMSKTNHAANTGTNVITLLNDNIFNNTQHAIKYTNNASGTVRGNTVSAVNTTNTLVTLFYAGGCTNNPTVTCNNLSNSWQAFEYNGPNSNVFWRGNKMQTHARGLVLNNNGIIGTQGSSGNPSDNEWNNSWASSFGTYIGASSAAQNSPIWYRSSGGIYAPPTPFGSVSSGFWYGAPNTLYTTTGSFNCGGSPPPPPSMMMLSTSLSFNNSNLSDEEMYIEEYSKYSNIKNEPSISSLNQNYISSQNNSSVDKFYQLNDLYYSGNASVAKSLNSTISTTNSVEYNYKLFYSLYDKYSSGNFSAADDYSLQQLSALCPGINGAVIYQARALRSYINKAVFTYNDNCEEIKYSARENTSTTVQEPKSNSLQVDLYPNPANNFVTLVSKQETEYLTIKVIDVNGKILKSEKVQTNKFIVNLELDLQNGIYFVDIVNDKNEKTVKKLVISK
jgi:hypothetical protein